MSETDPDPLPPIPRYRLSPLRIVFWIVSLTGILPYLFAREVMNSSIAAAVLTHVTGGSILAVALVTRAGRVRLLPRQGPGARALLPLLLVGGITGALLLSVALSGHSIGPWRGAYVTHAVAGLVIAAIWAAGPLWRLWARSKRARPSLIAAALAVLAAAAALAGTQYAAEVYFTDLTATTAAQARNPLFPAGARIQRPGDWRSAPPSGSCGEAGCHEEIARQWGESAHARTVTNPGYQTSLADARKRLGEDGVRWCAGCHAPLSLVSEANPRNPRDPNGERHSVGCLSCHAMSHVPGPVGNGHAAYAPPPEYPFANASNASRPALAWLHGFLVRVRPAPHRQGMSGLAPEQPRSTMCAPCHRLSVNAPQNGYKFLRFDETWSDWQASAYSGESAHAFAEPRVRADCVDCHSPHGHAQHGSSRAEAAASSVTTLEGNASRQPIRLEVFAMRRENMPGGATRFDAPLAKTPVVLTAGQAATVDILVENRGIGHSFPSGFPTPGRAWIEFTVHDSRGRMIAAEPEGKLAGSSGRHAYGLTALGRSGTPVNADDFYTMVAPISLRTLPAGEGEVARYQFTAPRGTGGSIRMTVRLMAVERTGGAATARAEHNVSLPVAEAGVAPQNMPGAFQRITASEDGPRFFAYGVALLRPGAGPEELAEARAAFREAIRLQPANADYVTALGRAYLAEGELLSARAQLEQALRIAPRSPRARAWLGTTLLRMGQIEAALDILNPLAREYPRDRMLWLDIGLCYLKSARYQAAADNFSRALDVDPTDAAAHYNLMRCYTALNKLTDARREEAIFRALQDDEPLTDPVEPYLQAHPLARREALPMHVHKLEAAR